MSDTVRPHRRQPTRLPRPWDSPGKNTGGGCHFILQCMKVKSESEVTQSCPTLRDPILQPTRVLRPWGFPGKSTGVGCHRLLQYVALGWALHPLFPSLSLSLSLCFFIYLFFCSNNPILVITYSSSTGNFLFPSLRRHLGFIFLSLPQLPKYQISSPHSHLSPSNISVWSFPTSVLRWKLPNSRSILLCII